MEEKSIIKSLLRVAYKRLWALILAFVIFGGAAFAYSKLIAVPVYSASTAIIVTNGAIIVSENPTKTNSVASTDITASLNLAETITDILSSTSDIYKQLAEATGNRYTYRQLMGMSLIKRRGEETLFVDISFISENPSEAIMLSNKFVELACDYIVEYIPFSNAKAAGSGDTASLIYPKTAKTTICAGMAGAVIVFLILFAFESMDQAIKGEEEFVANYDIPVLGVVPDFESAEQQDSYKRNGVNRNGY